MKEMIDIDKDACMAGDHPFVLGDLIRHDAYFGTVIFADVRSFVVVWAPSGLHQEIVWRGLSDKVSLEWLTVDVFRACAQ